MIRSHIHVARNMEDWDAARGTATGHWHAKRPWEPCQRTWSTGEELKEPDDGDANNEGTWSGGGEFLIGMLLGEGAPMETIPEGEWIHAITCRATPWTPVMEVFVTVLPMMNSLSLCLSLSRQVCICHCVCTFSHTGWVRRIFDPSDKKMTSMHFM